MYHHVVYYFWQSKVAECTLCIFKTGNFNVILKPLQLLYFLKLPSLIFFTFILRKFQKQQLHPSAWS